MKKMMQIISMIMIVVCVCSSSYTVNAALSDEEFQMLVELARDGDMLSNMLTENARHTLDGSDPMYHEWAVAKGYVVPSETEKVYIDLDHFCWGEPPTTANDYYYTYAKAFDTIEKWQEEIDRYFVEGYTTLIHHGMVQPFPDYLIEYEGRTMGQGFGIGVEYTAHWDTAAVQYQDEKKIVMTVEAEYNFLGDVTLFTVEFANTKAGWRVSGGSYFEETYGFKSLPAQTGDNAVISVIALSISALALGVVLYRKKRTI